MMSEKETQILIKTKGERFMKDYYLTNATGNKVITTVRATNLMEAIKMVPETTGYTIKRIVILNSDFAGLSPSINSRCSEWYLVSELPVYDLLIAEAEILGDKFELIDGTGSEIKVVPLDTNI
jgi:hypothetical protein